MPVVVAAGSTVSGSAAAERASVEAVPARSAASAVARDSEDVDIESELAFQGIDDGLGTDEPVGFALVRTVTGRHSGAVERIDELLGLGGRDDRAPVALHAGHGHGDPVDPRQR